MTTSATRRMQRRWRVRTAGCGAWVVVALAALPSPSAPAVVIQTASGTGNTTAPADDPGWSAVGVRGIGTGVYVGAGWVLTAAHVGAGPITLSGTTYFSIPGSEVQLTNAGEPGKTTLTDLLMYRITPLPDGIVAPPIASTTPAVGAAVTMIGAGRDRQPGLTEWSVTTTTDPWTWTEVASGGNAAGYKVDMANRTMRWGTNTLAAAGLWINDGIGDLKSIVTTFDADLGTTEAQAAYGDSGGAVYAKNGTTWELAGLMMAVAGFSGQPDPGANTVFGNATYSIDLSFYRPQILALVPEPSALALVAVAAASLGARWWHRSRGPRRRESPAAES